MLRNWQKMLIYLSLAGVWLVTAGPFLWLLSTSLKDKNANIFAYPPQFWPQPPTLENFAVVTQAVPMAGYFVNSLIVAAIAVAGQLLLCSMAAFPLARMRFVGRRLIFLLIVSTMMIPGQVCILPLFIMVAGWGLKNSYLGLVLPSLVGAFGIFLLRQAFLAVPRSLEEAAVLDGMNPWQIWWRVLLPAVRPALSTLAIFSFVAVWGDFMWPLLITDDPHYFTLALGVQQLSGTFTLDWRLVAAGAVISILPIVVLFAFCQRYFISGTVTSGVKE
ncbi:MAG: carbohydrate ABC transporter permease [Negativicutes bacterium]|nr:carbohydrate ABC transporter permease [Negativicutes bacterium]